MRRFRTFRLGAGLLAAAISGAVFYAVAVEPRTVIRMDVAIPLKGLPGAFDGYRILLISDLEASEPGTREHQVAAIAREARPDTIVVAGDLVTKSLEGGARVEAYGRMASYLGSLPAPDGVWFAQGHGEMSSRIDQDALHAAMEAGGVRPLFDDVATIRRGREAIALIGIRVHDYASKGAWEIRPDGSIAQGPGFRAAYLEYLADGSGAWTDYEFSGEMRFSDARDWAGPMVRSRLGLGEDRCYLFLRSSNLPFLAALPHGTVFTSGSFSWARAIAPGVWYRFRVRVDSMGAAARLRARAWPFDDTEPAAWDVDYTDATETMIPAGTAGLYAEGPGTKEFRDLRVSGEGGPGRWAEPAGADFLLDLLQRVPDGAPVIILSHVPDILYDAADLGVPLVLAGHTQGGQIRLPLVGPIVTDTRLPRAHVSGRSSIDGTTLYVTRGVGTTRVPLRFLSPPEATVITLTAGGHD